MKNIIKTIIFSIFTFFAGNAYAGPATDYLREKVKDAQTGSPAWDIDFEEISKATLEDVWKSATKKQKEEFLKVFSRVVKKAFDKHTDEVKSCSVDFLWESADGDVITVSTKVKKKDETTEVIYKFKKTKDKSVFLLLDVVIEETSMVSGWRSQFKKTLERRGLDGLIEKLRKKADSNE